MISDAYKAQMYTMNADDLVDLLRLASARYAVMLREGIIDHVDSEDLSALTVKDANKLIDDGLLHPVGVAQKELDYKSVEAVRAAMRSPRAPLDGLSFGRNVFFTTRWMREFSKKRYIGRTRKNK